MRVITVTQSGSGVTGGRRTQVIVSRTGPQGPAGGGAGSVALDDLTDVALVGTTSGDFLRYDGTAWTDTKIVASDLGTGTADTYHFLAGDLTWQDAVPLDVACKNTTASTIPKGTPVYITGSVGATTMVEVAPADSANAATMASIGLTVTELTTNATGYVRTMGVLSGVSTGAYSVNQTMFVASGGGLSNVRPTGTTTLVQNIGRVMRANNSTGEILILGPGRTNDVPNRIGTTYLADGTAGASNYLRGDQTWSTISAADVGAAPTSRNLTASTGLSGGGDLSADRSFSVLYGTTAGTAAEGNDRRLSDARTPLAHKTSHESGGSDELALAAAQITSGTIATARLNTKVVGGQDEGAGVALSATPASLLDATITLPACAAGDLVLVAGSFTILNNSTASRTYTVNCKVGATNITAVAAGAVGNGVTRSFMFQTYLRVEGTSDLNATTFIAHSTGGGTSLVANAAGVATENIGTGSLALDITVASSTGTLTQTGTMESITVTRIAA